MRQDPTHVVTKQMFLANQFPYMEVRRPFILGTQEHTWKATMSHWFMKLLEEDGVLTRVFTQNIDGLDYQTGISQNRVCNVHGSIAEVACERCGKSVDLADFCASVRKNIKDIYGVDRAAPAESSQIRCTRCGEATVKPSTVLFGSSLPQEFFDLSAEDAPKADLLIVAGTSLVVSPANSLVRMVGPSCPRLIVNKEPVGQDLGIRYGKESSRDIFEGGRDCDEVFLDLALRLGWKERLLAVREKLPELGQQLLSAL